MLIDNKFDIVTKKEIKFTFSSNDDFLKGELKQIWILSNPFNNKVDTLKKVYYIIIRLKVVLKMLNNKIFNRQGDFHG